MDNERIEKLSKIFKKYLGMNKSETSRYISTNKTFETISLNELELGLELFKTKYDIGENKLKKYVLTNPQIFESYPKLLSTASFLKSQIGIPKSRLGEAIHENPRLLDSTLEEIYTYSKAFESATGIPASDMLSRSFIYERRKFLIPAEMYRFYEGPLSLLAIYGIKPEDIAINPSILTNRMGVINNRLKLAKLNNISNDDFIRRNSYVREDIVYAEMMSLFELDLIDKYSPYLSKFEFQEVTGITLEQAKQKYPFDIDAQEFIRKDFKRQFKDLHFKTEKYFKELKKKSEENNWVTLDEWLEIMGHHITKFVMKTKEKEQEQIENE